MALVHRVNINICPLLNIFYCKYVINATRFKSQLPDVKTASKRYFDNNPSKFKTFSEMIMYRQDQAQRSIIVKVQSLTVVNQLQDFCSRFGKILNTFTYNTLNGQHYILIEFLYKTSISELKIHTSTYMSDPEDIHTVSPMFLYSRQNSYFHHFSSTEHEFFSSSTFNAPTQSEIIDALKPLKTVPEQMISLYNALKITELDIRLRFYTAEELTYYLSRLFVNLFVIPFGSSVNGFGQTGCDLDLLCKSFNPYKPGDQWKKFHFLPHPMNFDDRNKQTQFLETVYMLMTTCIPGIGNVKRIYKARVPIIKFTNYNTNMQCDITNNNNNAVYISEILYIFGELDYRVRPLVCTIRKWARVHNITKDNPGHWITNFSLTLLIIFYLQRRNILPPLLKLRSYLDKHLKSSHTSSIKCTSTNDESLDKLLFGFFEYYSNFDFKAQAICIREGVVKKKKDNSAVYIYNPVETALNVSKNVSQLELVRILHYFQNAVHTLISNYESDIIFNLLNYNNSSKSEVKSKLYSTNDNTVLKKQSELLNKEMVTTDDSEKIKETIK